jgi:hypothetical protein
LNGIEHSSLSVFAKGLSNIGGHDTMFGDKLFQPIGAPA